jgi:imidazolonepropionase-like amidohydrolase
MKKHHLVLAIGILVCVQGPAVAETGARYAHEGPILVRDVRIIDGLGVPPHEHREVFIQDGRIARIAVANAITELPEDTLVIDGKGLTLMPGFIDMHVHFRGGWLMLGPTGETRKDPQYVDLSLWNLLYAGVTTILDLGNEQDWIISIRDEIAGGGRLGPRIVATGDNLKTIEGVSSLTELMIAGEREIKKDLDRKQELGIDFVKLYTDLSIWEARFIMKEVHARGMTGVADFWYMNASRDAAQVSGVDGFAHGGELPVSPEDAEWFKDNDRFLIPTMTVFTNMGGQRLYKDFETRGFAENPLIVDVLGPKMVQEYYDSFYALREIIHDGQDSFYNQMLFGDKQHLLPETMRTVKTMHDAGVLLAAGTDAPFPPGTWFGESLHHELELFAEAGIPNVDIIKIATHNGSTILGKADEFGSIQRGLIADILIVEGNPAENISDTRNVRYVIKGGKLIDRESLTGHWKDLKEYPLELGRR